MNSRATPGEVAQTLSEKGLFGDAFGSINALFTAFAFAGVIYTIFLQRRELALQRQELAETRAELKRSADAAAGSEKLLRLQIESDIAAMQVQAMTAAIQSGNIIYPHMDEPQKEHFHLVIDSADNQLRAVLTSIVSKAAVAGLSPTKLEFDP